MASFGFQLDEHVPTAVARALRRHGIDVLTTAELGLLGASDVEQMERARAEQRVIVTHDGDFLRLHSQGYPHAGIAYCAQGSRSIGQIIAALLLLHEVTEASELENRLEYF